MPISATTRTRGYLGGLKGEIRQIGSLAFSGSYVTGGEVLTWVDKPAGVQQAIPLHLTLSSGRAGYKYEWDPSTGKVIVRQTLAVAAAAPQAELAAGAYPAGVTGDLVTFEAVWLPRGVQ